MAIPTLELNLASPPTLWRRHHQALGWAFLTAGVLAFAIALAVSFLAYREANHAGRNAILATKEAREVVRQQQAIQERLRSIDVEKELPLWRLGERILSERSLPWSRLTAELERSLIQDVRFTSLQRARNADQGVVLKLRGEAKSREAEESLVTALHQNVCFSQVILERETDRPGGGVEFEYTLAVSATPPPYEPLPTFGPAHRGKGARP